MSKTGLIILFGLLLAILPFIGISFAVKTALAVVLGLSVLVLGFLVRQERRWLLRALEGDHHTDAYTENGEQGYGQKVSET